MEKDIFIENYRDCKLVESWFYKGVFAWKHNSLFVPKTFFGSNVAESIQGCKEQIDEFFRDNNLEDLD